MTDSNPVYQVKKVFDPKTFGVVEELVQTGTVEHVATDSVESSPPEAPSDAVVDEKPKKKKRRAPKLPARKKN